MEAAAGRGKLETRRQKLERGRRRRAGGFGIGGDQMDGELGKLNEKMVV